MNVTIIYNADDIRVHRTGCRDIDRETRRRPPTTMYSLDAETRREVAEDFYSDFIHEGSMSSDEALGYSVFLPCCEALPLEVEPDDHGEGCDGPLNCVCGAVK